MKIDYDEFLQELDEFLKNEKLNTKSKSEEIFDVQNTRNSLKVMESVDTEILKNKDSSIKELKNVDFSSIKTDEISINNLIECDKPREKLLRNGASSLSESELLAILLRSGNKKEDVLNLSKKLWIYLSKMQSISDITMAELLEIDGIGMSKASVVISSIEFSKRIMLREKTEAFFVDSPKSVADIFINILRDEFKEHFFVVLLNTKNKIISWDEISRGDLNSSIVHPREVFKYALKHSANSIICLHNHPSGDVTPSREDIEITKRLVEVGELVGVRVLDHIIIGQNKYVSLREKGLI